MVTIADDLVALHSSDPVTVHLSACARMLEPSIDAVEAALYDDRLLIRHHAMRRTLWVMSPTVARLAHASSTTMLFDRELRRLTDALESQGLAADGAAWYDQARRHVLAALDELGPATARALGEAVPELRLPIQVAAGKSYAATQAAHTRVLLLLGFEAAIVRARPTGTWINGQYRWSTADAWLGDGAGPLTGDDPAAAAAALARRWLWSFGPATTDDLKWWTGWTLGRTRAALAAAGAVAVDLDGVDGWVAPDDVDDVAADEPWVALLPGLDPTTMGWKARDWYLDPSFVGRLFDRNGNGGPTVWADGRVVGGWVQRKDGTVAYELLDDVGAEHRSAIDEHAHRLEKTVGPTRFTVRFPAPLQTALLA